MRWFIELFHLDLCCLQKSIIIACGSERVNDIVTDSLWAIEHTVEHAADRFKIASLSVSRMLPSALRRSVAPELFGTLSDFSALRNFFMSCRSAKEWISSAFPCPLGVLYASEFAMGCITNVVVGCLLRNCASIFSKTFKYFSNILFNLF